MQKQSHDCCSIDVENYDNICIKRNKIESKNLPTHNNPFKKYSRTDYILNFSNYLYFKVLSFNNSKTNIEYKIKTYLINNVVMFSLNDILCKIDQDNNNLLLFFESPLFKKILNYYNTKYNYCKDTQTLIDYFKQTSDSIFLFKFLYFNTFVNLKYFEDYKTDYDIPYLQHTYTETIVNESVFKLFLQYIDYDLLLDFDNMMQEQYTHRETKMSYRYIPDDYDFNWCFSLYRFDHYWLCHEEINDKHEITRNPIHDCGITYVLIQEKNTNKESVTIKNHLSGNHTRDNKQRLCKFYNLPNGLVFSNLVKERIRKILNDNSIDYLRPYRDEKTITKLIDDKNVLLHIPNNVIILKPNIGISSNELQILDKKIIKEIYELFNILHWNISESYLPSREYSCDNETIKYYAENNQIKNLHEYLDKFISYDIIQKYFIFNSIKYFDILSVDQLIKYLTRNIRKKYKNLIEDYVNSILQIAESI